MDGLTDGWMDQLHYLPALLSYAVDEYQSCGSDGSGVRVPTDVQIDRLPETTKYIISLLQSYNHRVEKYSVIYICFGTYLILP